MATVSGALLASAGKKAGTVDAVAGVFGRVAEPSAAEEKARKAEQEKRLAAALERAQRKRKAVAAVEEEGEETDDEDDEDGGSDDEGPLAPPDDDSSDEDEEKLLSEMRAVAGEPAERTEAETARLSRDKMLEIETEKLQRTVFVGNVSLDATPDELRKEFRRFGEIQSLRFRSLPGANPKIPLRTVFLTKSFHDKRKSCNAYIVFKARAGAEAALGHNGALFKERHLRVDLADVQEERDYKLCVFVGNLPFDCDEEDLRKHMAHCGEINDVRIVRDRATGMGKGFAYVYLGNTEAVTAALAMHESKLVGRELRIVRASNPNRLAKRKAEIAKQRSKLDRQRQRSKSNTRTRKVPVTADEFGGVKAKKGDTAFPARKKNKSRTLEGIKRKKAQMPAAERERKKAKTEAKQRYKAMRGGGKKRKTA